MKKNTGRNAERDKAQSEGISYFEGFMWQAGPHRHFDYLIECENCQLEYQDRDWFSINYAEVVLKSKNLSVKHVLNTIYCCSEECTTAFIDKRQPSTLSELAE